MPTVLSCPAVALFVEMVAAGGLLGQGDGFCVPGMTADGKGVGKSCRPEGDRVWGKPAGRRESRTFAAAMWMLILTTMCLGFGAGWVLRRGRLSLDGLTGLLVWLLLFLQFIKNLVELDFRIFDIGIQVA